MTIAIRSLMLAERAAPRYTSYPTAPHFNGGTGPSQTRAWLGELGPETSLSLYLHVPYCRDICHYCGCSTKAARRDEPLAAYADLLAKEIVLLAGATRARHVRHIHWGGGTPSLLGSERLKRLTHVLCESFDCTAVDEQAIELDPRHIGPELASTLAAIGVNRVSLGVQDANARVQSAIGRVQPAETVEKAIRDLRAAGIDAINLDLMYGLPRQSEEDVRRTARWAASLTPGRLAIFGYAHVPWIRKHQRLIDAAALPGAGERIVQAAAAREELERAGYLRIGLDHFAKPGDTLSHAARNGTLRRNFQGYTTDAADALLPLGATSIGLLPQGYIQNAPDVAGWARAIEAGEFATVKGLALSPGDRARARVIERLMCDFSADFGAIALDDLGAEDALDDAAEGLDQLASEGVLLRTGRRVAMSVEARDFVRLAAACFDTYLRSEKARHSVAV